MTIVTLTSPDEQQAAVWRLAHEISYLFAGLPWVLVGGLMVQLHEAAAGRVSAFATGDLDAVVDVRAQDAAMHVATDRLLGAGFQAETQDDRLIYRFRRARSTSGISRGSLRSSPIRSASVERSRTRNEAISVLGRRCSTRHIGRGVGSSVRQTVGRRSGSSVMSTIIDMVARRPIRRAR